MTRTYTITEVPSRRGVMATCNGHHESLDGREHTPGAAAVVLAARLWPRRDPIIRRIGRTYRFSVQVEESDPPPAVAPQETTERICAPATAAPKPEESAR